MKIAICDDEIIQCVQLEKHIHTYFEKAQIPYILDTYQSADQLFLSYDTTQPYDLVILDIQMDGMNGMELAKRLRAQNDKLAILFVTGVTEFIYDSFDINAVNYLLKPYDETKLFLCLDKAIQQYSLIEEILILQVDKELIKIKEKNLLHAESDGHYIVLYTIDGSYRIKKTLSELEQDLSGDYFFKLGRSNLINLLAIERIAAKEIILINKTVVWIPKGWHKEISQAFMNYYFRSGDVS